MASRSRIFLAPAAVFLVMFVALSAARRGFALTDTFDLLDGTGWSARCLQDGSLSSCGWQVGQFALLQYVPAFAFHELGFSYMGAFDALVTLNGLAILGVFALVAVCVGRFAGRPAAVLAVAVIAASPFVWYAHAGYGEPLATVAVTAFVVLLLLEAPPIWVALAATFAGISKETAFPFLIALALIVWLIRGRRATRGEILAVVGGITLAFALNSGFNVFRYGEIDNTRYTPAVYRVPLGQAANHFLALLFSPTGGLLWMWPAFLGVLAAGVSFGIRRRNWIEPGIAILALFVALLVLFAEWYAPFGGTTWGPRLLLPWLPSLLVLCIAAYPVAFRQAAGALFGGNRFAIVLTGLLLVVSGLPHVIATVDSARYFHGPPGLLADRRELTIRPYAPDATCPDLPRIEANRKYYYGCVRHFLWDRGLTPAIAYGQLRRPLVLVFALAWCAAMLGLLGFARAEVLAQPPARA